MQGSPSTKMIKTQLGDIAQSFCKTLHQLYHDKCKCFGKGSDRNTRLDEIKNGSLDIAVVDDISCNIESYDCSVSLYVLLKCLVNC